MNTTGFAKTLETVAELQKELGLRDVRFCSGVYLFFHGDDFVIMGIDGHILFWEKITCDADFLAQADEVTVYWVDYCELAPWAKRLKALGRGVELTCKRTAPRTDTPKGTPEGVDLVFTTHAGEEVVAYAFYESAESTKSLRGLYRKLVRHEYTQEELANCCYMLDPMGDFNLLPSFLSQAASFFSRRIKRNDSEVAVNTQLWAAGKTKDTAQSFYATMCSRDGTHGCVVMQVKVS